MEQLSLWREEYRIGVEAIDAQHMELFAKVEGLLQIAMTEGEENNRKECLELLRFLIDYTVHHFETEEAFQRAQGYVSYEEHIKIHRQFKNTVLLYQEKVEQEFSKETLKKFAGTLMTWLTVHVCGYDRKIAKNQPLPSRLSFENADELIGKVVEQILGETYRISIRNVKSSVYNGYIEGKVIVRNMINGDRRYVFLYGFSMDMARALYHKISGADIARINHMDAIERSALIEIGDILSSHVLGYIGQDNRTQFEWRGGELFMNEYSDPSVDIKNSVLLEFETDCGKLEVLYCAAGG